MRSFTIYRFGPSKQAYIRPVGSKFEMVRPYYGTKSIHSTHAPPLLHPTPSKLLCSQITFYLVLKLLSLNPKQFGCSSYTCELGITVCEFLVFISVTVKFDWSKILSQL